MFDIGARLGAWGDSHRGAGHPAHAIADRERFGRVLVGGLEKYGAVVKARGRRQYIEKMIQRAIAQRVARHWIPADLAARVALEKVGTVVVLGVIENSRRAKCRVRAAGSASLSDPEPDCTRPRLRLDEGLIVKEPDQR